MRLLICAGGTGGGVYPALAVHSALTAKVTDVDTLWVGGEGGMEESLVKRQGIPFQVHPRCRCAWRGHCWLCRAIWSRCLDAAYLAARRILNDFKPDVLFFTGGYVAVPVALAGRSIPSLLYVPDIEPGMALKSPGPLCGCHCGDDRSSRRSSLTNKCMRPATRSARTSRFGTARQRTSTLASPANFLSFWCSAAARARIRINLAVLNNLRALLAKFEIIHISGETDWQTRASRPASNCLRNLLPAIMPCLTCMRWARRWLPPIWSSHAPVHPAWASIRSLRLPAILVPYPHAWRYQKVNADYLTRRGAAIILEDHRLNDELLATLNVLMENPNKLKAMRAAMFELSHPRAAEKIASALIELAGE